MRLYFLRHGLADWPDWDPARDAERPLSRPGVEKMQAEARAMEALRVRPDAILSSPLARARQTADIMANRLRVKVIEEPLLAPGFDIRRLPRVLAGQGGGGDLMLVGHEPDFSATIGALVGGAAVVMKKGGLARVDLAAPDRLRGELVWLLPPRALVG